MNLNELYHKYETMTLRSFLQQNIPQENLKRGSYGIVILTNKNYVYKLWTNDPAYDEFIDICMNNQDLPFVPKIAKVKKIKNIFLRNEHSPDTINVAKVEKLKEIDENIVRDWKLFNKLCNKKKSKFNKDLFKDIIKDDDFLNFVRDAIFGFLKQKTKTELDFQHHGNIMLRGNQYVITDAMVSELSFTTIHSPIDMTDTVIYGKLGKDITTGPKNLDTFKLAAVQAKMTKDDFNKLCSMVDIAQFARDNLAHYNLLRLIINNSEETIISKVIQAFRWNIDSWFIDCEDLFLEFIQVCEKYPKIAYLAFIYLIGEHEAEVQKLYTLFLNNIQSKKFDVDIKNLKLDIKMNRNFYKWIIRTQDDDVIQSLT